MRALNSGLPWEIDYERTSHFQEIVIIANEAIVPIDTTTKGLDQGWAITFSMGPLEEKKILCRADPKN